MQDVLYVVGTIAFFAVMLAFVAGCERIIGTREDDCTPGRTRRTGGDGPMNTNDVVGLVVAVLLVAFLVVALLAPERL